nr:MAG TPA: hypothetical protein [Caudoviricetes sp.]
MENYMEDYIEILDNDKEYKEVISILCQRRIRERLRNAITEIVENKRYSKFNDVKLSKLDFDVIGENEKLYVQGIYKESYIEHTLVYGDNYPEDAFNKFKILVTNNLIKDDFGQLACDVLSECVKNFIIIDIECKDDKGKGRTIYSSMIPSFTRQRTEEYGTLDITPIKVDKAGAVFEALHMVDLYEQIKSIKSDDYIPTMVVIYNRQVNELLVTMYISGLLGTRKYD